MAEIVKKKSEKELLSIIECYREYNCDWYIIPWNEIDEIVFGAISYLMVHYSYRICGVVDLKNNYPSSLNNIKEKDLAYCFMKAEYYPVKNLKDVFIKELSYYKEMPIIKTVIGDNYMVSTKFYTKFRIIQKFLDTLLYKYPTTKINSSDGFNYYNFTLGMTSLDDFIIGEYTDSF